MDSTEAKPAADSANADADADAGAHEDPSESAASSPMTPPLRSVVRPPVTGEDMSETDEQSASTSRSPSPTLRSALRQPGAFHDTQRSPTRRVSIDSTVYEAEPTRQQRQQRVSSSSHSSASGDTTRSGLADSGVSLRFRRSPPNSKTSARSSFAVRDSVRSLSRMSSNVGGLRESFFGLARGGGPDPLELSPHQEFDLQVIDESGGLDETIGQILKPQVDFRSWSRAGYAVLTVGVLLLLLMVILAETVDSLDGYSIDSGLVFGSLLTLTLCVLVFVTYHGVQSFQAHPNPLIYYKCVVDILLALRFLLDPLLLDLGMYNPNQEKSCAYLSGITQFLYFSSDCWYFAQIVDLYWSLTNPFMSVKANRKKYTLMVYSAGALSGLFTAFIPGAHGIADGNYCWTSRNTSGDVSERDFFRLNRASWLLFYMWMIIFYLSGIAVLVFGMKRLRSGLRDTLTTRREMLRNGALSITSYTIYWTIVFIWYALSFQTRTMYDETGELAPSRIFRAFTFSLSARGAVDYFVWFMINRPGEMKANWLHFSTDSADKKFSAQLNTALQEELIYFTIEGMTRAIQVAEEDLLRMRDRSPTQELVLGLSDDEDDLEQHSASARGYDPQAATRATGLPGAGSISSGLVDSGHRVLSSVQGVLNSVGVKRNSSAGQPPKRPKRHSDSDVFSFEIPQGQRPASQPQSQPRDRRHNPSSASTTATSALQSPRTDASASASAASIRFTPYKPQAFAELRSAYGIKSADFRRSFETSTKPNISEGASGAFMFFSGDKKYIVKSMAEAEARFLCEIADNYAEYLIANPCSLITKFYGCFKITLYERKFYFIVMENLFDVMEEGVQIHHRFDIKGSWVNRSYKRPRRGAKVKCRHCSMLFKYGAKKSSLQCPNVVGLHEPNVVLKDNDLRTRMRIGAEEGLELFEQLRDDSHFLCDLGIMDYSLLLGVMDIEFAVDQLDNLQLTATNTAANKTSNNSSNSVTVSNDSFVSASSSDVSWSSSTANASTASSGNQLNLSAGPSVHSLFRPGDVSDRSRLQDGQEPRPRRSMRKSKRVFGPGYYYVGVIDILQTWTLQKKLERFWKVHVQQKDGDGLSAIDPVQYQRRFETKLREIIAIPKEYYHQQRRRGFGRPEKNATLLESVQRLSPVLQAASALQERGAAAQEARRLQTRERGESGDTAASSTTEESDLEQAGRNPQPILLPFNQRLISWNSTRSNMSASELV